MEILTLIKASGEAILQIAVTCGVGIYLSKKGILTKSLQKSISNLNLNFLTPCLLFSNVASAVSPAVFLTFWPIPTYALIFTIISVIVSQTCAYIFRFNKAQANFSMATSMFPNTNSLPIPLIQSLASSVAVKMLFWGDKDTPEDVQARGISYIVIFAILGNFLRFSYGFKLLNKPKEEVVYRSVLHSPNGSIITLPVEKPGKSSKPPSLYSDYGSSSGDSHAAEDLLANPERVSEESSLLGHIPGPSASQKWKENIKKYYNSVKKVFNPPLCATFIGLFVGLVPFLKGLLFGPAPVLRPVMRAIDTCGNASIPLILLCLGAQLYGLSGRAAFKKVIWTIVIQRMLLMPLVAIGVVLVTHKFFSLGYDPVFVMVMMLLGSGPTAVNLMNICQAVGNYEDEMAQLLLYSYLFAAPALALWVVVYLWVVGQIF
ncbi:auxin efflux carrier [Basidiobolus meristosporus CBS 931.73]|uniref:Auxin efflux carrier n=1 Tax=Basidiobolus meristosporus CBS 931.73 TaxID=1314790 RepID=A0A1Y1Y1D1_9FUNG|nr:auxin efflux carrier [Basidiobolus meristosporus CBS 931.73]|eukprot:ORX91759.1 auxin efflux carrier [Basidiobolus meristosporus CBS 931.73]